MNRTEGLVLRKNAVAHNIERTNNKDDEPEKHLSDENEEEDVDSKETRLTLMEEVLLLGLKDKEVRFTQ
ncbi:Golgi phosphoprotein 3-like protein, partial [Stegodyphus mimosarum]